MRLLGTGGAAALVAVAIVQLHAAAQAPTPRAAYRIVCQAEADGFMSRMRRERAAREQPVWTAAEEREYLDGLLDGAVADPAGRREVNAQFSESWKVAEEMQSPFRKAMLRLSACAITLADGWEAGERTVAQLTQRWAEAQSTKYKLPDAASAPDAAQAPRPSPLEPDAAPAPQPSVPAPVEDSYAEDPYADNPVDCVRPADAPGTFKNVCDFPVYFRYCGVNPEKDSGVGECSKPPFAVLDISARGVQAGFTRAKRIYTLDCKSPKTPQDVEYVVGNGLRGTCK